MRALHRSVLPQPGCWPCFAVLTLAAALTPGASALETNRPPADAWFTNSFLWPDFVTTTAVTPAGFDNLHATESVGRLKVIWTPDRMDTNATVHLFASADEPGHWPARDWREYAAAERAARWEIRIPVEDVDVPAAYFLRVISGGRTNFSPLRLAHPRGLGLDEPTKVFWPFLEGFESGAQSWRLDHQPHPLPVLTSEAHDGQRALLVPVPGGKKSTTVGTTRVRGWQAAQPRIQGLSLWLRTRGGTATATFALHADAFTSQQSISLCTRQVVVTPAWQRVDLPFDSFPGLNLPRVDWFSLSFSSPNPCAVLVDDLQFLGPWAMAPL